MSSDAPAVISGTAKVGATLTCESPSWIVQPDRISFAFDSYRFNQRRVTRQQGAAATYVVQKRDAGRVISCTATGSNGAGFETTAPSGSLRVPGS